MGLADDRNAMIRALKETVVPGLREMEFSGSFPHFRRLLRDRVDLLTFQFDRRGGGFVVEMAKWAGGDFKMPWGERISPKKLTAHHLPPNQRLRLGAEAAGQDHWFRYDRVTGRRRQNTFIALAEEVLSRLTSQAEPWFRAG